MSLFAFKNNKIEIEPVNITIPILKEIYDRDKSKDKEIAFIEFCYIYHMSDNKSIYNNYSEEEKKVKILEDYFKDIKWKPDSKVEEACLKYKQLSETPSLKLLKSARIAVDKLRTYFETVNLGDTDSTGKKINKVTDLSNSISNVGKIIESLDKIEEKVKKEETSSTKIRGDKKISPFEEL